MRVMLFTLFLTAFLGCESAADHRLAEKIEKPSLVVLKSKRRLELYSDSKLVKTFAVGLGLNPVPAKKRQGDRATPEGDLYNVIPVGTPVTIKP